MKKKISMLVVSLMGINLYANSNNIFYNFDNDPKVQKELGGILNNKKTKSSEILIKKYNNNGVSNNNLFNDYNDNNEENQVTNNNIKITMGVNVQSNEISGYMKSKSRVNYFNKSSAEKDNNTNTGNLALQNQISGGAWFDIKFKDSILPSMKISYNRYYNKGTSSYVTDNTKLFKDVKIKKKYGNATSELAINNFDIKAYYTFKNIISFISQLNIGIGVNYSNINYKLTDNIEKRKVIDITQNIIMPYLSIYGETKSIWGLSLFGGAKTSSIGENQYYAYKIGVKYKRKLKNYNVIASIGYNYDEKTYKEGEYKTVLRYQGPYAEIGLNF